MIRIFFFLSIFPFIGIQAQPTTFKDRSEIKVGAEQFLSTESYQTILAKALKVGVVCNHTSVVQTDSGDAHLIDFLRDESVAVSKIFAPEHGFRGKADAGEKVESGIDGKTGIPVVSLYGSHKKPSQQDLEGIDVIIFDIQDVGARFYTYISTMTYVMEACAEQDIQVIILDRPNPNGFYVDGPILEEAYTSFVGLLPIPVVHGMTVGELAQMINGEGWMNAGAQCELTVVPCEGYKRNDIYILPHKPSPNLPNMNAILLYPSLCFFEGTDFSVGRGTDHPFEVFGHPNMSVGSFMFVPKPNEGAKSPKHEGVPCLGWDLTEIGGSRVRETEHLILDWLVNAYRDFPQKEKFFLSNGFFDKLAGTDALRKQIEAGMSADEIRSSWAEGIQQFKRRRSPYLIYLE